MQTVFFSGPVNGTVFHISIICCDATSSNRTNNTHIGKAWCWWAQK